MNTATKKKKINEQDEQELKMLEDMTALHVEADRMTSWKFDVPEPKELVDRYHPMHFSNKECGEYRIQAESPKVVDVATFRIGYLLGVQPTRMEVAPGTEFHRLVKEGHGGCLTSDLPVEIYSQYISFSKCSGHVLVGGLGLGMAATMILDLPNVLSVTVVEKARDIIKLVGPDMPKRMKIVRADLFDYLKRPSIRNKFDSCYFDIWYFTGEMTWTEQVAPLFILARKAGINVCTGWGEYEMQAQMRPALYKRAKMSRKYSSWKPYRVFCNGLIKTFGTEPPYPERYNAEIVRLIHLYLEQVGSPEWLETFKWGGR